MLADLSSVHAATARVLEQLERRGRVWVIGDAGTGRSTLASSVVDQVPGALYVQVPEVGPAGAAHILVQLAAGLPAVSERGAVLDDSQPLGPRAERAARALARSGACVVLRLPKSWSPPAPVSGSTAKAFDAELFRVRVFEVLRALLGTDSLRTVLVTSHAYPRSVVPWSAAHDAPVRLTTIPAPWEGLRDPDVWGTYHQHAENLWGAAIATSPPEVTPIELRLGVGLVGLGMRPKRVLAKMRAEQPQGELLASLSTKLQRARRLRDSVLRAALGRAPLAAEAVLRIADLDEVDQPLLTQCLGYGDTRLRISEPVRAALLRDLLPKRPALAEAHLAWADAHRRVDGVAAAAQTTPETAVHWLERVHHTAHAGQAGDSRWRELELDSREFLWERARSLSVDYRAYAEAAALYQRCIEHDDHDAYAWHYLGFNLERAETDPSRAEHAYQSAVRIEPDNPWWNGRNVTFLIRRSKFRAAERTWEQAVARVDPRGDRVRRDPWLAEQLHRHVAAAWLEHARPAIAAEVLEAVPDSIVARSRKLHRLRARLDDALEVDALGSSVYPSSWPIETRWSRPPELPERDPELGELIGWHPARVLAADAGSVSVVAATTEDTLDERRVFERTIDAWTWERASGAPAREATGYVHIGVYRDGELLIRPMVTARSPDGTRAARAPYASLWSS